MKQKTIIVKIGSSSITTDEGMIDRARVDSLCGQVAALHDLNHNIVIVTSGAIAAGLAPLNIKTAERPTDSETLQAISAVGQGHLIRTYQEIFSNYDLNAGQVLLTPLDFFLRTQYLHARSTLNRLLELGVIPIVNENDAVADDEIRWGDNDRIAALVAHLVDADLLLLLTDIEGVLTADPKLDKQASLIEEIIEIDQTLENQVGGSGSVHGSGGMASKVAAAKIAAWSGIPTLIAHAHRPDVIVDAVNGVPGTGTLVHARSTRLGARRLWIAFAVGSKGRVAVDEGAKEVLQKNRVSLLPAGVVSISGSFTAGDAVEISGPDGIVFAKGLVRYDFSDLEASVGKQTEDLPERFSPEVVHADDLVVLPA